MRKKSGTSSEDAGNRMVSVERLRKHLDPFSNPPWEGAASLSIDGIKAAIADGFFLATPYSEWKYTAAWTVEQHIARIAYLCVHGWTDAIEIDVGIPSMGCHVDWMITDGNHRFAAAIVREDEYILSSLAGCCATMRKLFGRLRLPASVSRAP